MWKVLVFAFGSVSGSEMVDVFEEGTGGWVEDMASPAAEIGSTVA